MEKFAVIRLSDKSPEGLERKSLKKELKELKNDGFKIYNEIPKK